MSVTQPFGYAQGRELVERQMVFDLESGSYDGLTHSQKVSNTRYDHVKKSGEYKRPQDYYY